MTWARPWASAQVQCRRAPGDFYARQPSPGESSPSLSSIQRHPKSTITAAGSTGNCIRFDQASVGASYSLSDTGSDSFLGDCLSNKATNWRPEEGMPTLPWRTISLALRSRP
jgi:hypothetical protein